MRQGDKWRKDGKRGKKMRKEQKRRGEERRGEERRGEERLKHFTLLASIYGAIKRAIS